MVPPNFTTNIKFLSLMSPQCCISRPHELPIYSCLPSTMRWAKSDGQWKSFPDSSIKVGRLDLGKEVLTVEHHLLASR